MFGGARAPTLPLARGGFVMAWGRTYEATMNAALDEISRLTTERDNAQQELLALAREHPEIEASEHFGLCAMALL